MSATKQLYICSAKLRVFRLQNSSLLNDYYSAGTDLKVYSWLISNRN